MPTEFPREVTPTPTAYLCTADTARAIRFYEEVFGARELFRLRGPDGRIGRPVQDQFYGDRCGVITDPLGYSWLIATRREEVSPEEMQRRWWAAEAKGE